MEGASRASAAPTMRMSCGSQDEARVTAEAGGRKAAAQPEMVGVVVVLHVEAVRAVGDPDARKPKLGDLLRVPIVGAGGEESHELLGGRAAHRCVCRR